MISRRQFLAVSTAGFAYVALPRSAFANVPQVLRAETVQMALLPDTEPSKFLGFNGSTPGPDIRVKQGATVRIQFFNDLKQASSIHWHGIRINNTMDGVAELTQDAVEPGKRFNYAFRVPDAGTYWYHSHNREWEQVARGLYGALIVEEKNPPDVDHDIVVFIDDWRLNKDGSQSDGFDNRHDWSHAGRLGNFAKTIFRNAPKALKRHERIRLRLINTATDRIFPVTIEGISGKVVALDGMPLLTPEPLTELVLAPAQRADVIADVSGNEVSFTFLEQESVYPLGKLFVKDEVAERQDEIAALPANRLPMPDLPRAIALTLTMEGGAMSRHMMSGMLSGNFWAFNGQAGMSDTPFYKFQRGQTATIDLVNDTRFDHGMHLHGHHFQAINSDDLQPLRDTILIKAAERQKIVCVFDNPGKWLLHCHMLGHQASGMKTWIAVV